MTIQSSKMSGIRNLADRVSTLGGISFVLVIGLVAGTIGGVPRLLLSVTSAPLQPFPVLVIGTAAVLLWLGAFLLWWIAIRRRAPIWLIAVQVTLGLIIADLFAAMLGMIGLPDDFAVIMARNLPMVVSSNLTMALLRAPVWLVGSVLALVVGRRLGAGEPPASATPPAAGPTDAIV